MPHSLALKMDGPRCQSLLLNGVDIASSVAEVRIVAAPDGAHVVLELAAGMGLDIELDGATVETIPAPQDGE